MGIKENIEQLLKMKGVAQKRLNQTKNVISDLDSEIALMKMIDKAKDIVDNVIQNKELLKIYKYETFEIVEHYNYNHRFTEFDPDTAFKYVDKLLEILKEELLIQIDLYPKNRITLNINDLVTTKVLIDCVDEVDDLEYKFKTHNGDIKTLSHSYADEYTEEETIKFYNTVTAAEE